MKAMASAAVPGERARPIRARRGSTGPPRARRSAPRRTTPAPRKVSTPTARQHSGASSRVSAFARAGALDQRRGQRGGRGQGQRVDEPRAVQQDQRAEQQRHGQPGEAQGERPGRGEERCAARTPPARAGHWPAGPPRPVATAAPAARAAADSQPDSAATNATHCAAPGAGVAQPLELGLLVSAQTAGARTMNRASAAIAPPPASSSRCGTALGLVAGVVQGGERRAQGELAAAEQQPGLGSREPVLDGGQVPASAARRWPAGPASCACGTGRSARAADSSPVTSPVTTTGPAPAVAGTYPSGTAERQRHLSDDLEVDPGRLQRRRDCAAAGEQHRAPARPAGPQLAPAPAGSQRLSGEMAAGRTTAPPSRTGFISTTSVGEPRPRPLTSEAAWPATAAVTGPCQVTRTSLLAGAVEPGPTGRFDHRRSGTGPPPPRRTRRRARCPARAAATELDAAAPARRPASAAPAIASR